MNGGVEMALGPWEEAPAAQRVEDVVEQRARVLLHEVRQPLAAAFALAEEARCRPGLPAEVVHSLDALVEQLSEVSAAASSALRGDGADSSVGEILDLADVLQSVLSAVRVTWPGRLEQRGTRGTVPIRGTRPELRRAVANVVDNAVRAAGAHGAVTVTVRRTADAVRILVDDDGPGFGRIPGGTGMGLTLAGEALRSRGGSLSTGLPARRGRRGARVALSLPLAGADGDDLAQPVRAG